MNVCFHSVNRRWSNKRLNCSIIMPWCSSVTNSNNNKVDSEAFDDSAVLVVEVVVEVIWFNGVVVVVVEVIIIVVAVVVHSSVGQIRNERRIETSYNSNNKVATRDPVLISPIQCYHTGLENDLKKRSLWYAPSLYSFIILISPSFSLPLYSLSFSMFPIDPSLLFMALRYEKGFHLFQE